MRTFLDMLRSDVQMWLRNRQAMFWTFFFPVLLMGLMGVVFGRDNAFVAKLAIVNHDGSAPSVQMVGVFQKISALKTTTVASESQAIKDLKDGTYTLLIEKSGYMAAKVGPVDITKKDMNIGDVAMWKA